MFIIINAKEKQRLWISFGEIANTKEIVSMFFS